VREPLRQPPHPVGWRLPPRRVQRFEPVERIADRGSTRKPASGVSPYISRCPPSLCVAEMRLCPRHRGAQGPDAMSIGPRGRPRASYPQGAGPATPARNVSVREKSVLRERSGRQFAE
jgi:hypothetical protein